MRKKLKLPGELKIVKMEDVRIDSSDQTVIDAITDIVDAVQAEHKGMSRNLENALTGIQDVADALRAKNAPDLDDDGQWYAEYVAQHRLTGQQMGIDHG